MSRRTIILLAASVIIGIGFIGTVSTDAEAYRAGMIAVASIVVVCIVAAFTEVAITVVYARRGGGHRRCCGWRRRGRCCCRGSLLGPGYYGAPAPVGCPYGYYYYAPYNRCVPSP